MSGKKCLITGCSGFIGSNLTTHLRNLGWETIGIDRQKAAYSKPDLFFEGDVRNQTLIGEILDLHKPDFVIHLAAVSTIQGGMENVRETWEINVDGTCGILEEIERLALNSVFVYASTDKVYGSSLNGAKYKENFPLNPLKHSPYDCSKAEADKLVREWALDGRGYAVVLRFCNIYGPWDIHLTRIVPSGIYAMMRGGSGILNRYVDEEGKPHDFYRDMLYVQDLCVGIASLLAFCQEKNTAWNGEAFNFGALQSVSIACVLNEIQEALGSPDKPIVRYIAKDFEIEQQSMDFKKAWEVFGFYPKTALKDGISKTVYWWKRQKAMEDVRRWRL